MATQNSIIAEDDDFNDPGYDSHSTTTSYMTSLASDIRRGIEENGRTYASFGKYEQSLPQDEEEKDRNDLQHAKFIMLLGNKLHLAPITEPQKILDLGTGTGIWAIDMADRHPQAQVTGVDIAPIQPSWVPPNCHFEVEDVEAEWLVGDGFDYIFGRELLMSIHDWPKLIKQAFERLKPGGYLELALTNPEVCCHDGSLDLENSDWVSMSTLLFELANKLGTPLEASALWQEQFRDAGFESVEEHRFQIPIGPWPKDKQLKRIGAFELANIDASLDSLMLRGFVNVLGRPREELQVLAAKTRKEFMNPKHHCNVLFFVVVGRKPGGPPSGVSA